jgi:amino acid transporter
MVAMDGKPAASTTQVSEAPTRPAAPSGEGGAPSVAPRGEPSGESDSPQAAGLALHPRGPRLEPEALPSPVATELELPETLRYRLKTLLLGPPLATERERTERLGKVAALGVLSPDCISSSAYGSEEMLRVLIPVVGVAAFSLVIPVTLAILFVLLVVTLSYREVVKVYTKAGGSYVVARENFGPNVAQVAAVALIIDYVVTVAVQVAAGTDAVVSAFPSLSSLVVPLSVAVVLLMAYGNLRGIREASRMFAFPTYFFICSLGLVIVAGLVRAALGRLPVHPLHVPGVVPIGHPGRGLLMGASVFIVLRSFANGGSSLTGLEAISNGVSAFRPPEGRNARITLAVMSSILGFLVFGVSLLARFVHAVPYGSGTPTVVSQIARAVVGSGPLGTVLFYIVQAATMLILYTGGNTSFNGFPYLTSFVAGDSFLPRMLERRGHRLAYSNGIVILTVAALVLLVITRAQVDALVAVYAIGVFTGFTMAGAGMVQYHRRTREPGWRLRLAVNLTAAMLSGAVVVIFAVTKFTQGAWVVVVLFPLLVFALIRLHRQYREEAEQLEAGAAAACEAPVLRRHVVIVLVDRLDLATARAVQYARTLAPDELRAVHFDVDPLDTARLESEWRRLGLSRLPLEVVECPDRRVARAALEFAAEITSDGDTELTVLLPRRGFAGGWRRLLHDRSADRIAAAVSALPHVNATIVPFQLRPRRRARTGERVARLLAEREVPRVATEARLDEELDRRAVGTVPIGEVRWRQRARVAGRIRSVTVPTQADRANLECMLVDATGAILLVFQGRREVPGIRQGARLVASGMVGSWGGRLAILNPEYELVAPVEDPAAAL